MLLMIKLLVFGFGVPLADANAFGGGGGGGGLLRKYLKYKKTTTAII